MKIHLEKIGADGFDLDEPVTSMWLAELLGTDSPFQPANDGHLKVHLTRVEEVVHVRGKAHIDLSAACSRCLGSVHIAVRAPLELTMVPRDAEPNAQKNGEVAEEDVGISTYDNKEIDLARVVHDEVFLELPMRPLCAENCAGLCAQCGKNLNDGPCACEPQTDMRWDALKHIKIN